MMRRLVLCGCLAFFLEGCFAVGPDYRPPSLEAPTRFAEAPRDGGAAGALADTAWWESFQDPVLNELISRAVASNLDVAQARARVRQARADARTAKASLFPAINIAGSSTTSSNGLLDAGTGETTQTAATGTSVAGASGSGMNTGSTSTVTATENSESTTTTSTLFTAGFDATWEIDIFGGLRRERESALAELEASQWDLEATRLTLLGDVATNYIDLRASQEQLDIARRNLHAQQQTVEVTRERFRLGLTSQLDVAQAEGQAATTAADVPSLERAVKQSIHRLGVLTGQGPGALTSLLAPARPQPALGRVLAAGLPSELLARRPDLRKAERELAAASADIGVAVAELYPKFDLTAGLGLQGVSPSNVAGFSTWYWSVVPGVSWPLFDMGAARAGVEKNQALFDEALAAYRAAFHTALEDVENALAAYYAEAARRESLTKSVASYEEALSLAQMRYTKGLTSFLDVLVVEASLYDAQQSASESEATLRESLVSLYKALGGGWKAAAKGDSKESASGCKAAAARDSSESASGCKAAAARDCATSAPNGRSDRSGARPR
ncbi:efflux transporter outer membrane subunit [Desulfolutivibrio sulfoxidireducens]|nr:efflux transporter outer membrane subunit [Desulfolutivibrio sulfoxidireducens]